MHSEYIHSHSHCASRLCLLMSHKVNDSGLKTAVKYGEEKLWLLYTQNSRLRFKVFVLLLANKIGTGHFDTKLDMGHYKSFSFIRHYHYNALHFSVKDNIYIHNTFTFICMKSNFALKTLVNAKQTFHLLVI